MVIRKAQINDIDLLVKLRMDYLLEQNAPEKLGDLEILEDILCRYFVKAMVNGEFLAVIAEEDGNVYSTAFLSIAERPPRSADTSCMVGTAYNVYTYPPYRRRGLATKVMKALCEEAKLQDVDTIDLHASSDGKVLYEKLGFQIPSYTYMKLKNKKDLK